MKKQPIRTVTNQPGIYQNQKNGKYDVKYSYTEYDPISNEKKRRASGDTQATILKRYFHKSTSVNNPYKMLFLGAGRRK